MNIAISKMTPFIKKVLGHAQENNVSLWSLVDRALTKYGVTELPKTREGKFNLIVEISNEIGLNIKSKKQKKRERKKLDGLSHCKKTITDSKNFLFSYEWRKIRMQALELYGARCQCCGATPKDGVVINVDHIKPRKTHPELALDLDNLQILCDACNHGKGNWSTTDWRVK